MLDVFYLMDMFFMELDVLLNIVKYVVFNDMINDGVLEW